MIRLLFLCFFLLLSLLTVCKAPAYYLWLAAILVTEFPWVFMLIVSAFLIIGFWTSKYQLAGTIVGLLAIVFFCIPVFQAFKVSAVLKTDLQDKEIKAPFSFWRMFSRTEKQELPYQTFPYTAYADKALNLDFYASAKAGKRPCVIVVHGGSWSSGDSQQLPELNSVLAKKGYQVASINYRMAPKYQTPAPVEDIANAIIYLKANADKLNIDTNNFVLLGRSAGAQIALLAAYTLKEESLKGVIDFYGPADMVWGYSIPSNPLIMDSRKVMEDYIGGTYQQVQKKYENCSPLLFVSKNSPPTLIIHGENDVLVAYEHSRRLHAKLNKYKIYNYFLSLPWATHGFDFNISGPGAQLSTYAVTAFLKKVTQY